MVKYLHEVNDEVFQKLADEKNKDNIFSDFWGLLKSPLTM